MLVRSANHPKGEGMKKLALFAVVPLLLAGVAKRGER